MSYKNTNLDFYDDGGALLKDLIPDLSEIPSFVKTASVSSADPSDYALVILENGSTTNKFNISDQGNTWLSSLYYSVNKDSLPEEAQKVASTMIKAASEAYGVPLTDTILQDSIDYNDLESNVVDLSNSSISPNVIKEDGMFALGDKYPINNPSQVIAAQEYFVDNVKRLKPEDRREYAVKVAHVAGEFGVSVSEEISDYSGEDYSPTLDNHLAVRYSILQRDGAPVPVRDSLIKVASLRGQVSPEEFAHLLTEFDSITGLNRYWDTDISDPWYSTFSIEKVAMGMPGLKAKFTVGEMTVTEEELKLLSQDMRKLTDIFGEDFAVSFSKDPVAIFKSMPLPQKKTIARMASDTLGRV